MSHMHVTVQQQSDNEQLKITSSLTGLCSSLGRNRTCWTLGFLIKSVTHLALLANPRSASSTCQIIKLGLVQLGFVQLVFILVFCFSLLMSIQLLAFSIMPRIIHPAFQTQHTYSSIDLVWLLHYSPEKHWGLMQLTWVHLGHDLEPVVMTMSDSIRRGLIGIVSFPSLSLLTGVFCAVTELGLHSLWATLTHFFFCDLNTVLVN